MPKVKLTKNELRTQKDNLKRFRRYLPVLHLKKQLLQKERERARHRLQAVRRSLQERQAQMHPWTHLLTEKPDLKTLLRLQEIVVRWDNIAGVDIPLFVEARWEEAPYDLFAEPLWLDHALPALRDAMTLAAQAEIVAEQERRLHRELRVTAQRVNLFEQVKIPQAQELIRKITIQLADQETAAFGWALIAKRKLQQTA